MIVIDEVLIDESVVEASFKCALSACKGACCVVGERGAPVTSDEVSEIEKVLPTVESRLPEQNRRAIHQHGFFESYQGDLYLSTVGGKECVFATIDVHGVATCELEQHYNETKSGFQKPISCHLFPVRVRKKFGREQLVYMQIPECESGRSCGAKENIPLYEFLATALERKFGSAWLKKFLNYCRNQSAKNQRTENQSATKL
jgi:hypothetical protein